MTISDNAFLDILKEANVDVAEEISTTGFLDTGSYALNALISASIYGGIPNNRVTMWAGMPSAGKTYLTLSTVKTYLDQHPNATVLYFDSEFSIEEEMISKRGIDINRFHKIDVDTLQDFRAKSLKILEAYEKQKKKPEVMMVLDSLSNLPTNKEVADSTSGSDTRDMTKAQIIRSIFRVLTNKLGRNNVSLTCTSHVYSSMDMYSPVVISGGSGGIYAASTVVTLNKSKLKEGTDIVGNIIRATTYKSRYSKENQKVELKLDYNTGLDRYFGLLPIAEKYGIIKKVSTRYELPDGTKCWGKDINNEPEKVFTKDILDKIDEVCRYEYGLGNEKFEGTIQEVEEISE